MTRSTALAALIVAALGLSLTAALASGGRADVARPLPVYQTADLTPEWVDLDEGPAVHRVGAFRLRDQTGAAVTEVDLDGQTTVVSFFFATCTTLCPTLRTQLARVDAAFPADARVQILSHSVNPEADSVGALRAYAEVNGARAPRWRLLTGDRGAISRLARDSYFASAADGAVHTETFWLLDGQRRIRGVYNGTLGVEVAQLIRDVETLRQERGGAGPPAGGVPLSGRRPG